MNYPLTGVPVVFLNGMSVHLKFVLSLGNIEVLCSCDSPGHLGFIIPTVLTRIRLLKRAKNRMLKYLHSIKYLYFFKFQAIENLNGVSYIHL